MVFGFRSLARQPSSSRHTHPRWGGGAEAPRAAVQARDKRDQTLRVGKVGPRGGPGQRPPRGVLGRPTGARGYPPPGRGRRSLGEGKGEKRTQGPSPPQPLPTGPTAPDPRRTGNPLGVFKPPRRDALGTWKGGSERSERTGRGTTSQRAPPPQRPRRLNPPTVRAQPARARGAEPPPWALPARDGGRPADPATGSPFPPDADQPPPSPPPGGHQAGNPARRTSNTRPRGGPPPLLSSPSTTTASRPRTRGPGPSPRWGEGLRREAGCRLGHGARRAGRGRGEAGDTRNARGVRAREAPTTPRTADERRGADEGEWGRS